MNDLDLRSEKVTVDPSKAFISFIGQGSADTIISWNNRASDKNPSGQVLSTNATAFVSIESLVASSRLWE